MSKKKQHQWSIELKAKCANCDASHMVPIGVAANGALHINQYELDDVPKCESADEKKANEAKAKVKQDSDAEGDEDNSDD